jgi:peptidyl-prolyl cis-trans isomerase D
MAVGEPDDAELQALLEEEAARFTAPEYRSVSLVTLSTEALVDEIEIEESRLRAEYEARRDFYTRGERRRAGQLLASDREVIEAAAAALAEGAVFADLATSMAADGLTYSTLGPTTAADLPDEFAEAIFALDEGEVSEPVESLFGWHLFRVIEIEPEDVLSFAEVRDDIRRDLALDAALDQLPRFAAALDDEIAAGASLEDAAGTVGVELRRFAALDATGRGPDGRPLPDAPTQEILAAIFAAPEGEVSLLEETADGTFFVFRVEAVQPPQRRALEDVRDEVVALWRQREQDSLAAERVEEIMANARAGRTLEAIAADLGDEVVLRSFEPLRRTADGAAAGLTPEAVAALFDTKAGELVREPVPTVEGKAMLRTDTVTVPDASAAAEVAAELKAGIANDILVQYEAALRGRYPVQVNNAALASLFPDEAF